MSEFGCRKCRDWKRCPGSGMDTEQMWFNYQDISWCAQQVVWLLKYADIIHAGQWPVTDTTVAGGMRGKTMSTEAAFTKVVLTIAEVDQRLSKTGWRGRLLAEEAKNREKMDYLSDDAKDALYYVAGWNPRNRSFSDWRKGRKYHQKATQR